MKLRYKIAGGFVILATLGVSVLAIMLSHNSDCPPAASLADNADPMQAVVYRCYGSPEVLQLESIEKPAPQDNEVLVKIRAAAVNPLDWHYMRGEPYIMRLGSGLGAPKDPRMGVDFAGTVEAVGRNVKQFKRGDEVFGGSSGAFAEYVTIPHDRALVLKPANITFEQAVSVPIAAITRCQRTGKPWLQRAFSSLSADQKATGSGH